MQKQALVVSVGGTLEPIVKSILEHKPKFICYICSQGTIDKIGEIKNEIKSKAPELEYTDYKIVVDDAQNLDDCYRKSMCCKDKLQEWGVAPEDTIVDYTGGTKNMSVALAMATMRYGYSFSYVGGTQRTKEGLGIVVDGTEEVRTAESPWTLFAVDECTRITAYFNKYQFTAAQKAIDELLKGRSIERSIRQFLEIVNDLCESYILWEQFRLKEAAEKMKDSQKRLKDFVEYGKHTEHEPLLSAVTGNIEWLNRVARETGGQNRLHKILVCDLMSNAQRRADEGKYDDAVARLYRALEMVAQIAAQDHLNITDTGKVREEIIPEAVRGEFVRKYKVEDTGLLKVPLRALFELLSLHNVKEGVVYMQHEEEFKGILSARNQSILAHGQTPVSESTYQNFYELICNSFGIDEIIHFPEIKLN